MASVAKPGPCPALPCEQLLGDPGADSGLRCVEPNPMCPALSAFDLGGVLSSRSDSDPEIVAFCRAPADCPQRTSLLVIRDPRAREEDNERFLYQIASYPEVLSDIFSRVPKERTPRAPSPRGIGKC